MTIFYICRHGETVNNKQRFLSGWADTPLTENGVQDAEALARRLAEFQFDKIITSDLGRAVATADIIVRSMGYSGPMERRSELREINYGDLNNQPISAYPALTPVQNADYAAPNGESLVQMQKRVMDCIHELALANPDKTILLVAHDGTINAIKATYNNESIGITDTVPNGHDTIVKFEYEADRILSYNELS